MAIGIQPKVGTVLVNWNGLEDTLECLDALGATGYPNLSVFVVDNGSTDGSVEALGARPDVQLIALGENLGKAGGDRRGIEAALAEGCDYVLLLNSDTILAPDMLSKLLAVTEADRSVGIVGPKIFYADAPSTIWFAGGTVQRVRGDALHIGMHQHDDGRFDRMQEVDYITSCAMLVRRDVFDQVGTIDEEYFIYFDETDFCLRAAEHGWRVVFVPDARLWHKVSSTMGIDSSGYWFRYMRSRILFIRKRFPRGRRLVSYFVIAGIDLPRTAVHFLRRGKPSALRGYVSGALQGLSAKAGPSRAMTLRRQPNGLDPVVCFSSNDWDDIVSSKVHIMRILAKRRPVLYVDTLGVRPPTLSRRHLVKIARRLARALHGPRAVEPNLWVWSPIALPFHGSAAARRLNAILVSQALRRIQRKLDFPRPMVWSYVPTAADIVARIETAGVIYHCIDDYSEFEAAPRDAIAELENRMCNLADLTVVSSRRLFKRQRHRARAIAYVPHGVDHQHFAPAPTPVPPELDGIPRPIAGFVGRLANWIDLELVEQCARSLPTWSFVLVGPTNRPLDRLTALPNVRWLGAKPYTEVPRYIAHFDVCLAPFTTSVLVDSVNPLKVYEYLAGGRPVVSTPIPELEPLRGVVRIVSHGDFARALQEEAQMDSPERAQIRRAAIADRSWTVITDRILELFDESRLPPAPRTQTVEPVIDELAWRVDEGDRR